MKKNIIIIIFILVISASAFVFFKVPASECNSTATGWYCTFDYDADNLSKIEKIKEDIDQYEQECSEDGGHATFSGYLSDTFYCHLAFDDEGAECINSEECKGGCTIDREFVESNYPERGEYQDITCKDECTGTCSKYPFKTLSLYPLRFCDWWFEVDNGTIIDHTGIICD